MKKLLAAACLSFAVHSLAADAPPLPPPVMAVANVLQLSGDQIEAFVAMIGARDSAVAPLAAELQKRGQAIDQELQSPDADPATVGRLLLEARSLQKQIEEARRQAAAQFEEVLTPDQKDRLQHVREIAPLMDVIPAFRATGLL